MLQNILLCHFVIILVHYSSSTVVYYCGTVLLYHSTYHDLNLMASYCRAYDDRSHGSGGGAAQYFIPFHSTVCKKAQKQIRESFPLPRMESG